MPMAHQVQYPWPASCLVPTSQVGGPRGPDVCFLLQGWRGGGQVSLSFQSEESNTPGDHWLPLERQFVTHSSQEQGAMPPSGKHQHESGHSEERKP